jgi:PAS domain S-box-containing protein
MGSAMMERVLVVDDEPQVLVALQDVLADDFQVYAADSGHSALNVLERERDIAVVVTDQRMPRMSGDELLVRMRGTSHASSILLTGFADLAAVIRAVNEGKIFAYVTKPWITPDLRLKVGKAAERFRLEQTLADERKLLHDLMESTPDGIYFKDIELRLLRVNRAFSEFGGGGPPEGFVGKRFTELPIPTDLAHELETSEREVLRSGRAVSDRLRRVVSDGAEQWFSYAKAPVRNANGEIVGLVGISRDVTERIRAGQALLQSERRFREQSQLLSSILESMGEGLIAADIHGRPMVFNRRAEKLLGARARDVPPQRWAEACGLFLRDENTPLPAQDNALVRAMDGQAASEQEVFVRNSEVQGALVAMSGTPLRDESGRLAGGIAVLRDVTQQRRLEQQLLQAQKMEAIGHLAGGVAHDFNNLLSVIMSYGDLLFHDLPEESPLREDVAEMLEASRRAASLTRQLLAFSRRQVIEPRAVNLNELVSESEKMLRRILGEDIDLQTALSPSLGQVKADPTQIEQIILNLTVNARDAMPGGGRLTIETLNLPLNEEYAASNADVAPGEYVVLAVTDTGAGMDEDTIRHVFEPFFTTKPVGQGTGLGLSTVYGIVKQSGGHIEVHSEAAHGTSFKVFLPRIDGLQRGEARESVAPETLPSTATILLVEDDEAVRRVALRILQHSGYRVLESRTPAEAISLCRERGRSVDLLLTDVVMPEVSGPKLAEELANMYPHMLTLYMSGYPGGAVTGMDVLDAGVAFLPKPFAPASLVTKVQEVLASRVADQRTEAEESQ